MKTLCNISNDSLTFCFVSPILYLPTHLPAYLPAYLFAYRPRTRAAPLSVTCLVVKTATSED